MKRDIKWLKDSGKMAECLVSPERNAEFDNLVGGMIENKATLQQIINALNERGDLTDNEWTAVIFALGCYIGQFE
jgi:hypothetical protein